MLSRVKKVALFALPLLGMASALLAGDVSDRTQRLQDQMKEVRGENAVGTAGAVTAPSTVNMDEANGWSIDLNILYWQPSIANNEFAQSNLGTAGSSLLPAAGQMTQVNYEWRWGFRLGLGKTFKYDNWDLLARYTWFGSKANNTLSVGSGAFVLPSRGNPTIMGSAGEFVFCQNAQAKGKFSFQAFDLTLGRGYYVSSNLSFHPDWGLKFAWAKNSETIEYTGGDAIGSLHGLNGSSSQPGFPLGSNVKVYDRDDFWSIGPRVGFNGSWHVTDGISIFGNLTGSLLYANHDVQYKNIYSPSAALTTVNVHGKHHQFIPDINAALGLRWESCFNKNAQRLGIGLGWEIEYLWNAFTRGVSVGGIPGAGATGPGGSVNEGLTRVAVGTDSKSLSMQGLTIDIRFDF